jgi:pyruvate dehydrogenase (quinone)
MAHTVADHLLDRLEEWGIRTIFGYSGDGINGILGALDRAGDRFDFIQPRHEEMAAFMAGGFAKFTDEDIPGVCLATSGPGAIHLLNGLYDAKMDHQPVVAIVGQKSRMSLGASYQQEVDLLSLFKDVAGDFVQVVMVPEQIRHLVDRAIRISLSERTVTCLIIPDDVQALDAVESPPREHGAAFSGSAFTRHRPVPSPEDLAQAADILNAGERVAMLVGAGALGATDEVIQVANRMGAGVAKALLGKAAVPDDEAFVTGSIGLLGTAPSWRLMMECDTFLMIGSGFPYAEFLPPEGQARGVQIDIDPKLLSIRYPMELALVGDAQATLSALLPLLQPKEDRSWQEGIEDDVERWWEMIGRQATMDGEPMAPQRPFWELNIRLPDRAIVTADSGTAASWYARHIKMRRGMMGSLSGNLASMVPGVPYAIAAKFAHPDRPAIAFVGDGAMQMLGLNELITARDYYPRWADPRLIVCVLNNGDLNMVTWEMRAFEGNPRFEESQEVPSFPYADFAEMIGLRGIKVEKPEEVGPAWDQLLAADRPSVLEVVCDPDVPTIPPHVTLDQFGKYMSSLLKGDSETLGVLWQSARQGWQSITTR